MLPAEQAALDALEKFLVDAELPAFVAAEEGRLPANYSALVVAATSGVMPSIIAALDKVIAKQGGAAAPSA